MRPFLDHMHQGHTDAPMSAGYMTGYVVNDALPSASVQAFLPVDHDAHACKALLGLDCGRTSAYYTPHLDVLDTTDRHTTVSGRMRLVVSDLMSHSYFPALAAEDAAKASTTISSTAVSHPHERQR